MRPEGPCRCPACTATKMAILVVGLAAVVLLVLAVTYRLFWE